MFLKIKNFVKKHKLFLLIGVVLLTIFAILFLLMSSEKKTPPLEDPEIIENGKETNDTTGPKPDTSVEEILIRQPLGYHKNYQINFSARVVSEMENLKKEYPAFLVKEEDNFSSVETFVKKINKDSLKYEKSSPREEVISHSWIDDTNSVSYDLRTNSIFMLFENPISIPEITLEPRDKESLKKNLNVFAKKYFSKNFEYEIVEITMQGNYYKVNFSRLLGGVTLGMELEGEYFLITPDGRLKEGRFLLVDFEEYKNMKFPLISSTDLSRNISLKEYPKTVHFQNLDSSVEEEYEPYGYIISSQPYTQAGNIEVERVKLIYLFDNVSQEKVTPVFFFEGSGLLDVQGTMTSSDFLIYASALHSRYVFVHPSSHFEMLEELQ